MWGLHVSYIISSNDQRSHVTPHSSCLNLRNAKMPLMILLASCDSHATANGIKLPSSHGAPHFDCFVLRNVMVPVTTLSASQKAGAGANGVTRPKKVMLHLILIIFT